MQPLSRRKFLKAIGIGAPAFTLRAKAGRKPNFVFILIDDLGWMDTACYGSQFYETPHIDRLASEGVRFTNAYAAAPLCVPTRASIMTGKYPARVHVTMGGNRPPRSNERLLAPQVPPGLPLDEITIAEALRPAGYVSASIGKWHLGGQEFYPEKQGFDVNLGGTHIGMPSDFFYPGWTTHRRAGRGMPLDGKPGEYLTDRLTDAATDFIAAHQDSPFLLYLSHYAVHIPLQAKEEKIAHFRGSVRPDQTQNNPIYAAMIASVDESVGRVAAKLEQLKLTDDTVIIFTSDNGGLSNREGPHTPATSNAPLREGKHFLYEGGIREPLIIKWRGVVEPSVCTEPVISIDFLPTMIEMAGVEPDPKSPVDGISLVPLLRRKGTFQREAIFWHFPHYDQHGVKPGAAVRKGDYKLIEFFDPPGIELYNLARDIGETRSLVAEMPGKAKELQTLLHRWQKSVGAQIMELNPNYQPSPG